MSKLSNNGQHAPIDAKWYRKNKLLNYFASNPITAGIFLVVAIAVLAVTATAGGSRIGVRFSLSNSSTDSGVAFSNPTTSPPVAVTPGSTLLPNPVIGSWMNARQNVANPVPTPCVNLECTESGDNGASGEGQFRVGCQYSHFNYDDPIVYPGQAGKAHLHMYWGNTHVDANTKFNENDTSQNSLTKYGGGSCQGAELNRTAYWQPALLDGTGNVVLPKSIVVYYKTPRPAETVAMPQGLKMIGGNSKGNTTVTGYHNMVEWDCYDDSASWLYPPDATGATSGRTIPATCPNGYYLHSIVTFPQCWDGKGLELANTVYQDEKSNCPANYKRLPQVQYIVDWPRSPTGNYNSWYLSSDRMPGMAQMPNGSTLHGDWFGGWEKSTMDTWTNSCVRAARNCSLGQMGGSNKRLLRLPRNATTLEDYSGAYFVKTP